MTTPSTEADNKLIEAAKDEVAKKYHFEKFSLMITSMVNAKMYVQISIIANKLCEHFYQKKLSAVSGELPSEDEIIHDANFTFLNWYTDYEEGQKRTHWINGMKRMKEQASTLLASKQAQLEAKDDKIELLEIALEEQRGGCG